MTSSTRKLHSLVADAGAFIKNAELHNFAERIFTLSDVVSEIRDSATRARLTVLPYTLEFREPSVESIKQVTEFSKQTGDYRSLSAVDLRVIALTYQLEKEFCDPGHINVEPGEKVDASKGSSNVNKPLCGFYLEKKTSNQDDSDCQIESTSDMKEKIKDEDLGPENMIHKTSENFEHQSSSLSDEATAIAEESSALNLDDMSAPLQVSEVSSNTKDEDGQRSSPVVDEDPSTELNLEEDEEMEEEAGDNVEDDDEGWISPHNIAKVKADMGIQGDRTLDETDIKNACFTTDFAMQNVLIRMGLHVVSINGMLIQQARSYVLKCHGCFKETTVMDRQFCVNCGNKTLMKVAVTVSADGTMQYHYPRRRPFNIRGTKYSLPKPKGGRNDDGPLLVADQKTPHNRLPKKKDNPNALDPDFVARTSPFASKDVTSKAFNHGYHMRQRDWRNPNEAKKRSGKKKR